MTPDVAPADHHPYGSENVPASLTEVASESKNSQVPPEAPLNGSRGKLFDEVSQEVLKAAEEIFHEEDTSAMTIPLAASMKDPLLSIEDFLAEERTNPTPSESDAPSKLVLLASALTQATLGSTQSVPIILDDGK